MLSIPSVLSVLVFLSSFSALSARDFHLTPEGAGARDGSAWEHALGSDRFSAVFNEEMKPGDRLLLGSGTYPAMAVVLSQGGEAGRAKEIAGVDLGKGLPLFSGDWSLAQPSKGATACRIEPGVSHVTLRGIRIRGYAFGVHAPAATDKAGRSHLRFEDVTMEQFRHGFYLSDCDDVQLTACVLRRYSKHAFRFEQGCDRVTLRDCVADCSEGDPEWERGTELFPFGYFLNDGRSPNTAFVFEGCVARNHLMPLQTTKYKNGDGFVVEETATGVQLSRCRAIRNQDAGFDLKVRDARLTDCVAIGNSRGFRIWFTGTLENCFAGWGTIGLWNNGGPVRASRCTFHELADAAVATDDDASREVLLADCLITGAGASHHNTARGSVILQGTVETSPAEARYPNATKDWDGSGPAMDSETYPGKGYRSSRQAKAQPK